VQISSHRCQKGVEGILNGAKERHEAFTGWGDL
jgi:hypothetical protein